MKEILTPQTIERDPSFTPEEAQGWLTPLTSDHVNIINPIGIDIHSMSPEQQSHMAEDILAKYVSREADEPHAGMGEVVGFNLGLLEDASRGIFEDSRRSSSLVLRSRDHIDDQLMDNGADMREKPVYHWAMRTIIGERPAATDEMLNDLYTLTGAVVVRDDRAHPKAVDKRYLLGAYKGKPILFTEFATMNTIEDEDKPHIAVDITDDLTQLQFISNKERQEISPYVGTAAADVTKKGGELAIKHAMIRDAETLKKNSQ